MLPDTDTDTDMDTDMDNDMEDDDKDEDTLVVPTSWRKVLHPRRGGTPVRTVFTETEVATAVQELVEQYGRPLREIIGNPASEPGLAVAALPWLDSAWRRDWVRLADELTPAGAAAVVAAVCHLLGEGRPDGRTAAFADLWVAVHGLGFAARAVAELWSIDVAFRGDLPHRHPLRRLGPNTQAAPRHLPWLLVARRVRAHLAAAGDDQYARVAEALAPYRADGPGQRAVTSYLLPTRTDWVAEDCRVVAAASAATPALLLLMSAGTSDQAERIGHLVSVGATRNLSGVFETLAEGVGAGAAPLLDHWLDEPLLDTRRRQHLLAILAALPSDEALRLLLARAEQKHVQPAVLAATKRFPARALRLLPTPPSAAASGTAVPDAAAELLPRVLVTPPWAGPRRRPKQVVIDGLDVPTEQAVVWRPGERESWAAAGEIRPIAWGEMTGWSWPSRLRALREGALHPFQQRAVFTEGPEELVRPYLRSWLPAAPRNAESCLPWLVSRFELDALPLALHLGARRAGASAPWLLPYASAEVATVMADWLLRLTSVRADALAWFARHPALAAAALVPAAVGPAGPRRRAAGNALRTVARGGHAGDVLTAARRHGEAVAAAVEALLTADPLDALPRPLPAVPDWVDAAVLPQVLLRDRKQALPAAAVRQLCTMLALSKPGEPYAGVAAVREAVDPASFAAFGWALFERWQTVGAPAKDGWALDALGCVGDDDTVRRLAPLIRAWPGQGGHARAVRGLEVLAGIGTDPALAQLHAISRQGRFRGLRERAAAKIAQLAADRELTPEQLADRLVPDFGLDANGSLTLDYGPRRFVVGFDERLRPRVLGGDGTRRAALPKPGARDDERLAPAAYQRFIALRADVRAIADHQLGRLEEAMVTQRRWTVAEFGELFVRHPLLGHLARRLVWLVDDADGGPPRAVRITGDRTLVDVEDDPLPLPAAGVRLAHPLHLGDSVGAWSARFAAHEIPQPFPQLDRAVYTLTDAERGETVLRRAVGITVPTVEVLRLERRGWRRGVPLEAGVQGWLERDLPAGRSVALDLDPGILVADVSEFPSQRLGEVSVSDRPTGGRHTAAALTFGELDPVIASEILTDLTDLTDRADRADRVP
ncbi:protein of unknown function (DUF4132) [Frankia sp. EI5c]|uniref:DUF4132 domain-containing protein n=1 Tax=Frankia sp. EI5c TaxID=683316 RepID=UPI0007C1FED6|nr:DUF4132 domain-containing protein [Frankia sp. EI5c]OAA29212.1 protein of unknown function (DUF4132) [Frankia sp. EI5c]